MTVIQATEQDLSGMIELLKSSLGESLVPKSETYFRWKHYDNPFGASKVLLAKEGETIIGLRAFMFWDWESGSSRIKAVRAVDTATDPAHQGKGIFRKLTMQAVDECRQEGVSLVFNSPNPISMAGYLKMGWHQAGRMPIMFGAGSLFPRRFNEEDIPALLAAYPVEPAISHLRGFGFPSAESEPWHTPLSYDYLHWRYAVCPVVSYGAVSEPGRFGFVFRLKRINRFYEMRICEAWTLGAEKDTIAAARKALRQLISGIRPLILSYAPGPYFAGGKSSPGKFMGPYKKGPMTTLRPLAMENLHNFNDFHHWQPSMGTMELF